jgi:hypothetical protein
MITKITHLQLVIILLLSLCPTHAVGAAPVDKGNFIAHISFIVDISVLNVRQCPGTECKMIGSVKKGQKLYVMGIEGNWLKISFNNKTGYVSRKYVRMDNNGKTKTGKQAKRQRTEGPPLFMYLSKILPVKSLLTWVIILSLAAMLSALFYFFKFLDEKFIELLGSSEDGGVGWPLVTSALAGILLAVAVLWNGEEAQWFLTRGIGVIPSCRHAVHWIIYIAAVVAVMTLPGTLVESVVRVGPVFAALRFLIVTIIGIITFFVAFYMTILVAIIVMIIIGLYIALAVLSAMGSQRRVVYYYYD